MPERSFDSPKYSYGFNGKEKDERGEWGSLTHYDYGFRIYNPGIARFLSVDPLSPDYPFYTPYQFAGNKPTRYIDLDGLEEWDLMQQKYVDNQYGGQFQHITSDKYIYSRVENGISKFWLSNGEGAPFKRITSEQTDRLKYSSIQTGTGFGLSIDKSLLGETQWTSDMKNVFAGMLYAGAAGPMAAGAISVSLPAIAESTAFGVNNFASGSKFLFAGNLTERGIAGVTEIGTQVLLNAATSSEWNYASTLSAIAMPKRYFISGAVGGGFNLGVSTDDGGGTKLSFGFSTINSIVGGLSGLAGGRAGDELGKLFKTNPGSSGVGVANGLRNLIGFFPAAASSAVTGSGSNSKSDEKK